MATPHTISKIQLPNETDAYNVVDETALHSDDVKNTYIYNSSDPASGQAIKDSFKVYTSLPTSGAYTGQVVFVRV